MNSYNVYWGDTHLNIHPGQMDRFEDAFETARQNLDIFPAAYYPFEKEDAPVSIESVRNRDEFLENWKEICEAADRYDQPGELVCFPGYEWHGNRSTWGDHNVYYPSCEHAPLLDTWELPDLVRELKKLGGIAIPHHTAYMVGYRGKDWSCFDEEVMPFTEIFSSHGCSERTYGTLPMSQNHQMGPRTLGGTAVEGLDRGYRIGFIGSGDTHNLYSGRYGWGLMGVCAEKLTRESVWSAFLHRRVYAVTGDRIELDFRCNGEFMGSSVEYRSGEPIHLTFKVKACDEIDRIELVKNGKIVDTVCHVDRWHPPSPEEKTDWKIRITAGWGPYRQHGFDRKEHTWNCSLKCSGITSAEPCFTWFGNAIGEQSSEQVEWTLTTGLRETGFGENGDNTQSVIIGFRGTMKDQLNLNVNSMEIIGQIADLIKGPHLHPFIKAAYYLAEQTTGINMSEYDNHDVIFHNADKLLIGRALPSAAWELSGTFTDENPGPGNDYYYLRVIQVNGQRAWSSPVFVSEK